MERTRPAVATPLAAGSFFPRAPKIMPIIAMMAPSYPREPAEKRPIITARIPKTNEAIPITFSSLSLLN